MMKGIETVEPDSEDVWMVCPKCNKDAKESSVALDRECTSCEHEIDRKLVKLEDVKQLILDRIADLDENIKDQPDEEIKSRQIRAMNELQQLFKEVEE